MSLLKKYFEDEEKTATVCFAAVLQEFGTDALSWRTEILREEIEKKVGFEITDLQADKISAATIVLVSDLFFNQWNVFETVCHIFCNQPDDMDTLNPLEAEELMCGLSEVFLLVSLVDDEINVNDIEFDPEVLLYAGRVFHNYGFKKPPALFSKAIMPKLDYVPAKDVDDEKNEAMMDIFEAHTKKIISELEEFRQLSST